MPFTVSHAAFALPFAGNRRWSLPAAALTLGAMSPDFEYVAFGRPHRTVSHTVEGIFVMNLPVSLAVLFVLGVVAPGLARMVPARLGEVRERMARWEAPLGTAREVGLSTAAIVIGAASHLVIDSFTHRSSWGARNVEWLHEPVGFRDLTGSHVLQIALSALGLVVLAAVAWRWLGEAGVRGALGRLVSPVTAGLTLLAIGAVIAFAAATDVIAQPRTGNLEWKFTIAFLNAWRIAAVVVAVAGLALRWTATPRRSSPR